MIIDMHRHPVALEWYSEHFWKEFNRMAVSILQRDGMSVDAEMTAQNILPLMFDIDGRKHLEQMEIAGIDKTVMFLFDVGLLVGEPDVAIQEQNMTVFRMAETYPDKMVEKV